jgi:murein DD-endopeptidase MepM/ murein hydrolase activator NlpD
MAPSTKDELVNARLNRRSAIQTLAAFAAARAGGASAVAQSAAPAYSYPMGLPGRAFGDGLYVRIAYAAENARYYPGWWHTGENWHALGDETAGLGVYAVAAGEVVFAGYDYPGRVVIVQHTDGLYAMYGHLDYELAIEPGQAVERAQLLGTVLARTDDLARSHFHFELRTFLTKNEINGATPQFGVNCGYECPPGPGYWPMAAPEHPSQLGWRNPTHVINRRAWLGAIPAGEEAVVCDGAAESTVVWTAPSDRDGTRLVGEVELVPGDRYPLLEVEAGEEDATGTSAAATRLWYQIGLPNGDAGWVQAVVPVAIDSGSDGRPSSLRLDFVPAVRAGPEEP